MLGLALQNLSIEVLGLKQAAARMMLLSEFEELLKIERWLFGYGSPRPFLKAVVERHGGVFGALANGAVYIGHVHRASTGGFAF